MRSFFKAWSSSGFGQSANAALFRNSWTNGGGYSAILYEMGQSQYNQYSNNWINHWQSWSGMNSYWNGAALTYCYTNNNCKIDLANTQGSYEYQGRINDAGTDPYFKLINAFGVMYEDSKTWYNLQQYYNSSWSEYCTSCV